MNPALGAGVGVSPFSVNTLTAITHGTIGAIHQQPTRGLSSPSTSSMLLVMQGTRATPPRLLLEGRPGAGKTTVAVRLIEILQADGLPVSGFVTREVRGKRGRRLGFELETVDGRRGRLAHVDLRGGPRVGRYGVALDDLERLAVPLLEHADGRSILVVDELGKMELASARFRDAVAGVLARPLSLVATVHAFGHPFTDAVKRHPSVTVVPVTRGNRDALAHDLAARVRSWTR